MFHPERVRGAILNRSPRPITTVKPTLSSRQSTTLLFLKILTNFSSSFGWLFLSQKILGEQLMLAIQMKKDKEKAFKKKKEEEKRRTKEL